VSTVRSVVMLKFLCDRVYNESNRFIGAHYTHMGIQYIGVEREIYISPCLLRSYDSSHVMPPLISPTVLTGTRYRTDSPPG
jgi:hypothetical protein